MSSEAGERAGGSSVLDRASVASLRAMVGDDPEALAEIVEVFVDNAPAIVRELHDAIDDDDAERVRRAAHTLKGNAATFGALELADVCRALEQLAGDNRLDGAPELAGHVVEELDRSLTEIEALAR